MADGDDLLSPDEIEALMRAAREGNLSDALEPAPAPAKSGESDLLSPEEIEALMLGTAAPPSPSKPKFQPATATSVSSGPKPGKPAAPAPPKPAAPSSPAMSTLQAAESQLQAAMSPGGIGRSFDQLGNPVNFELPPFDEAPASGPAPIRLDTLQDVELDLRIELGRTELLIDEVLKLREGSVVPLDKLAGDPVDILVNGMLIARGEVLVLNDNFCVRVAEILAPEI